MDTQPMSQKPTSRTPDTQDPSNTSTSSSMLDSTAQKPTRIDYEELAEFRYRLRKFLHFSEAAAVEAGITPSQHQLMLSIAGYPNRDWMTPTEIAERLQVRHHSALGLIQRCQKAGLVRRFDHPTDKRSVCVELTDQGRNILEALTMRHQAELRRLGLSHRNFMNMNL